jgi:hypothetical protein
VEADRKRDDLLRRAPWLDRPDVDIIVDDLEGGRFEPDPDVTYWFEQVTVRGVDFSRGRFGWYKHGRFGGAFDVSGSMFVDCDFSKVRFDRGSFGTSGHSTYTDCRFDGAEIWSRKNRSSIDLDDARFTRCSFAAKVRMWFAFNAEFVGCSFATRVGRCYFYGLAAVGDHATPHAQRVPRQRLQSCRARVLVLSVRDRHRRAALAARGLHQA